MHPSSKFCTKVPSAAEGNNGKECISLEFENDEPNEEVVDEQPMRRSTRIRTQSTRLSDYDLFTDSTVNDDGKLLEQAMLVDAEPADLSQALADKNRLAEMKEELQSIKKNKIWGIGKEAKRQEIH